MIKANTCGFKIVVEKGESQVGGGSMPLEKLPTYVVSIGGGKISESKLESGLRKNNPPVIARIKEEKVILDVRTIFDGQLAAIAEAFGKLSEGMNI
jgi:L-seryl-tRNA(Ser) seleniumtransferase